jgi:hypothetical protein
MTTLHIGKKRTQVITASDGSTPTGVVATAETGQVSVSGVTLTGVSAGSTNVNFSADGYQPVNVFVTVTPLPTLIVTDGPEV